MIIEFFDSLPIAGLCLVVAMLMFVFSEVGFQIGVHVRTRRDTEAPASLGPMVGGLLGMLAFSALVTLVADLNRPQSGLIEVGQQSMVVLQKSMSR